MLGFQPLSTTRGVTLVYNESRQNFSFISYCQVGQLATTILFIQNLASIVPSSENLVIYDLGLSEGDVLALSTFCNSSAIRCSIIQHDLSNFPSYIMDEKLHLFRPLIIKHALSRFKTILFTANHVRLRSRSMKIFNDIRRKTEEQIPVQSLKIKKLPITSNSHPKMVKRRNDSLRY